ncbi:MAG: tRNA (adenosine(37)-N6)-threonylcarbamoyltransferase complex ATPase subunit type 1 TsaE [Kordiimonadaceae bacterium]|jgi:tRNA threonylcarbamoyladenosine biosynthesis protein TsaE|nr:tRNA (adenosine(37)-N6)-threonylcarbamoyltransferase complex ATPase subunit type 1 TsaE [Kordiimonadaceae bacterium]MBT6037391.1 tRNA (adenosine(37)-N6)-threonylcarbamoyltransferase complex ATPase subunit type 1 TsaE [Kordiimonadaceae bacterium]MBT6329361.1 tRNA (adenosine(37)-N6)-threonylcarbamoyltransferase complex ATPase subunit type 1 TsaE [Kordiimonadaceae bacterium]
MTIKVFYLDDLSASRRLAGRLASTLKTGDILAFEGGLGSGKTEFCRAIIHAIGYREDVPSPTFNLLQIYEPSVDDLTMPAVWHMDLYRLEKPQDVYELGIEDGFDTAISLIEWPDRMAGHLPDGHLSVSLSMSEKEGARNIIFEGDDYWNDRLKELED